MSISMQISQKTDDQITVHQNELSKHQLQNSFSEQFRPFAAFSSNTDTNPHKKGCKCFIYC